MSSPTPIYLSNRLIYTLAQNNIAPQDYSPAYGGESACLDLYNASTEHFIIKQGSSLLIPTGLHIVLPKDRVALIQERGSVSKTNLKIRAGVVDAGYTGEIFCSCFNYTVPESSYSNVTIISPHQKLPFQLLVVPVFNQFSPLSTEQWLGLQSNSKRQAGAFGSSDKSSS